MDGSTGEGAMLDRIDLMAVERGLSGMRRLDRFETLLLEASRRAEQRHVAEEEEWSRLLEAEDRKTQQALRRLRSAMMGVSVSLPLLGVVVWGWRAATIQARIAREETEEARGSAKVAEAQSQNCAGSEPGSLSPGGCLALVRLGEIKPAGPRDAAGLGSRQWGRHAGSPGRA